MMINKRLIGAVPESKKYIAGNVALQWCSLCANIAMMSAVTELFAALFAGSMTQSKIVTTAVIALAAVAVRYGCTVGASRMGYLSSKAVKKTLRGAIYDKLLCLGASYSEQVKTSEVVQVAVEGVDQLETYALASGMSFLCTDTKGDLFRNYAGIAKDCYGYQIAVLDLRNPTRSDGNNLLHLINKYMDMVSLILQNLYREILTVADENGGRLKNRVVFFADELGTCPPIQSLELMFSASRSRGLMLVPIVQSITGQLQKNYGKEGSEIIVDNCQVNLYGGFAPASQTAVELSKSLGSRTVMSGSISRGKNDPSQSLQMMERPLMTPDELKSMPKGSFIVAKTGVHPMKVKLRLFLDWGIRFGMPYEVPEKAQRFVAYADKQELEESIIRRHYGTIVMDSEQPQGGGTSAGGMAQGIQAAPDSRKTVFRP